MEDQERRTSEVDKQPQDKVEQHFIIFTMLSQQWHQIRLHNASLTESKTDLVAAVVTT